MRSTLLRSNHFYRPRLARQLPFPELPFTSKSEIVEDQSKNGPFGTNLTYPVESYTRMHQTSGTAGKPLLWLDTPESWDWFLRCWEEVYRGAGIRAGDCVYIAFSFGPFIGFWGAFEAAQRMKVMVLSGGGQSTSQRLRMILDRQATMLVCTPTYALRLAEVAAEEGLNIRSSSVRVTIHAGEPGASIPSVRKRIQDLWGARTYDHAGMTEIGAYGFECEIQAGVHINEDEFIAEVIDPVTLRPVATGERGELVLTNLGRLGMPLIRYRTGDLVVLSRQPCACGRKSARMVGGILGRADDMITVRGVNLFPSAVENIIRRHPEVVEFSIEVFPRRQMQELALKLELRNAADSAEVVERISRELLLDLHIRAVIDCVPAGQLPRFELKSRRIRVVDPA
jgi:phenylacetate-CoA ligase